MSTKTEIADFLRRLKEKMNYIVPPVVYKSRNKNSETLLQLDLIPDKRRKYLTDLKLEDYLTGPNKDTYDTSMPDYYEFGIFIKSKEIYIKINLGKPNKPIFCYSFHIAEDETNYPYKKE